MEPIPETVAALEELGPVIGDGIHDQLLRMARRVRDVVPSCVGLSLAVLDLDLTFTLEATDEEMRALDAAQYLDSGPCVAAADLDEIVEVPDVSVLDEARWQLFAQASGHVGIRSTLTIPLHEDGQVRGTVNLYAAEPHAFEGRVEEVAASVGGWAPGVVANADLSFLSRRAAALAPHQLADAALVGRAVTLIRSVRDLSDAEARDLLQAAATRAGLEVRAVAKILVDLARPSTG